MAGVMSVVAVQIPWHLVIIAAIIVIFVLVGLAAWWQSNRGPVPGQPSHGPDQQPPESGETEG